MNNILTYNLKLKLWSNTKGTELETSESGVFLSLVSIQRSLYRALIGYHIWTGRRVKPVNTWCGLWRPFIARPNDQHKTNRSYLGTGWKFDAVLCMTVKFKPIHTISYKLNEYMACVAFRLFQAYFRWFYSFNRYDMILLWQFWCSHRQFVIFFILRR